MNLDLLSSVELTASAAIVVSFSAAALGRSVRIRYLLTAVLGLWFIWVVGLAATNVLGNRGPVGTAGLGLSVILPIIALVMAVRKSTSLATALRETPLSSLIAMNALRILGVSFLLLRSEGRVASTFALSAGWGDIAVGFLAIPLAWVWARSTAKPYTALRLWNMLGLLDLICAITLGIGSSPGPLRFIFDSGTSEIMTTLPWLLIPGFLVPLFLSSHLAIFWRAAKAANENTVPSARVNLGASSV